MASNFSIMCRRLFWTCTGISLMLLLQQWAGGRNSGISLRLAGIWLPWTSRCVSPSFPKPPGERTKTDKRYAMMLARQSLRRQKLLDCCALALDIQVDPSSLSPKPMKGSQGLIERSDRLRQPGAGSPLE